MFLFIIFVGFFTCTICTPIYSNYQNYVHYELEIKPTISTTTPTITSSTIPMIVKEAEHAAHALKGFTRACEILIPALLGAICSIISLCYYLIKFYKNNCIFKCAWCRIKSPKEYQRRKNHAEERIVQIALQQFVQQSQIINNPSIDLIT